MNSNLRTSLWNAFLSKVFSRVTVSRDGSVGQDYHVFISLWKSHFKLPLDEYERDVGERKAWYRDQFEALEPARIFALLEFCYSKMIALDATAFSDEVNSAFDSCAAPFRMLHGRIVHLESSVSTSELEKALTQINATQFETAKAKFAECVEAIRFQNDGQESFQSAFEKLREGFQSLTGSLDVVVSNSPSWISQNFVVLNSVEKLKSRAEAELYFASASASIIFLLNEAVKQGVLPPLELEALRYVPSDPWGERKL